MSPTSSAPHTVKPLSTPYGGKIAHSRVPGATVTMSIPGGQYPYL